MIDKKSTKLDEFDIWRKEIDDALGYEKPWRDEAEKYLSIYKDQHNLEADGSSGRYNIFWANTQTLRPLVYSNLPDPNVTRRFSDKDESSRVASELMERSLSFFLDIGNDNAVFEKVRDDFLITGRGIPRVYFDAPEIVTIEREENGEIIEDEGLDLDTKKVRLEYFPWEDFLISTEKCWNDVRWCAYRHRKTKEELIEQFGSKGESINLDATVLRKEDKRFNECDHFRVAEIWEIWDKSTKSIIWLSNNKIISIDKDAYNLKDFFPSPRPIGCGSDPESLLPIPLYRMYKGQAEELNQIDARKKSLVSQVKYTGVYNSIGESGDIENLLNGEDGEFNPIKGVNTSNIKDNIYTKPLGDIIATIAQLNDQQARIIQNIRDITGLSDIVRGTTLASETATAQRLKGDFAISRIQPLQKEMEIAIRDTYRIMVELIVENFSIEELAKITNLKVIDIEGISEQAQFEAERLIQEANPQTEEEIAEINKSAKKFIDNSLEKPLSDLKGYAVTPTQLAQIDSLLKNDLSRTLSIDVETDSTVLIDQGQEKRDRIEYIQAISTFSSNFLPLVQAGVITPTAFNQFLSFISKPFKVGRNLEEYLLSEEEANEEPEKPNIDEQIKLAENNRKDQEIALKAQEVDIKQQLANVEKAKIKQNQIQFEDKLEFEDVNKEADRSAKTTDQLIKEKTERVNSLIRESNLV